MIIRQNLVVEEGAAKRQRLDRYLKASWFASVRHKEKMLQTKGLLGQALEEKTALKAELKTRLRVP